jgi:hypothetical protein
MPSFDAISIASVMVLECFVRDERSGADKQQDKGLHVDAFFVMKTLSLTPIPVP